MRTARGTPHRTRSPIAEIEERETPAYLCFAVAERKPPEPSPRRLLLAVYRP